MNTDTILRLLENAGFRNLSADAEFLYAEDPSCILRSFETFAEYAWIIIAVFTGLMLFGWSISLLRGAKNDIFSNLTNLMLIFGTLTISKPILNFMYGGDLFGQGCKTIQIPLDDVNKLLDMQKSGFAKQNHELYEEISIIDSGPNSVETVTVTQTETVTVAKNVAEPVLLSSATAPVNVADLPTAAVESGKDVIYTMPNGQKIKKTGGYRSWRNNNPGNIRYSEFTRRVGAIGQAGGFAVFPSEDIGMYAIKALLRTDSYNKLTVAGAISRYAPPSENNTSAYHRNIEKLTGLSINKRMSELTDAELDAVAKAIKKIEGWKVGTTTKA
ncbi:MAG: hypothetical protein IKW57_04510 [Alphaproteobacteria bacterium]|nr:hypothetical protein [Alphaproteobacteria bacterium]